MTSRLNRWGARGGAGSQCVGPRPGKSRWIWCSPIGGRWRISALGTRQWPIRCGELRRSWWARTCQDHSPHLLVRCRWLLACLAAHPLLGNTCTHITTIPTHHHHPYLSTATYPLPRPSGTPWTNALGVDVQVTATISSVPPTQSGASRT